MSQRCCRITPRRVISSILLIVKDRSGEGAQNPPDAPWPERVGAYDAQYPAVSATMVVLIIGGVTAANAAVSRSNLGLLGSIIAGVVALNGLGCGVGFLVSYRAERATRIASVLSVGMRDFAVAAALMIAAGLPTIASLPAVVFGVVEMTTSAGLVK